MAQHAQTRPDRNASATRCAVAPSRLFPFLVLGEAPLHQRALVRREPGRGLGAVVQVAQHRQPDRPPRAGPRAGRATRHPRSPDTPSIVFRIQPDSGPPTTPDDRDRRHEERDDVRPVRARIPLRQVPDDAGEEAGLGDAQQEAEDVEAGRAVDEHRRRRHQPPHDHDPGDPQPRADAAHQQVAGHLEEEVADEEDPRADAVGGVGEGRGRPASAAGRSRR